MRKIIFLLMVLSACQPRETVGPSDPADFAEFVSAYTSGVIGSTDAITVELSQAVSGDPGGSIRLNPSARGKVKVENNRLSFQPDDHLLPGTTYEVTVMLSRLFPNMADIKPFVFRIRTMENDFRVETGGYRVQINEGQPEIYVEGTLRTSDRFENKRVEQMAEATLGRDRQTIAWTHAENSNDHHFRISGLSRGNKAQELKLVFNGKPLDIDRSEKIAVNIPAAGDFSLLSHEVIKGSAPQVLLVFSDPLDQNQESDGLFLFDFETLTTVNEGNVVRLFCPDLSTGTHHIRIDGTIRSHGGTALGDDIELELSFDALPPEVRFVGEGSILPQADQLIVPFYAVNLEAVDIRIVQIFSSNVLAFLQDFNLNDGAMLRKVGRPVYQGKLDLTAQHPVEIDKGSAYSLNLSELITPETGAIYQVELSMRPAYSIYPCSEDADIRTRKIEEAPPSDYWSNPDNWYLDDWFYYNSLWNWQESENPCHSAYYSPDRRASKNVLASNIGIIVQQGDDETLGIVTTNLLTGEPEEGVTLDLYDFQLQPVGSAQSDAKGMASLTPQGAPFAVVASKGNDRGYLKLTDGTALSLSQFDVSGTEVKKGLKGFIYGERDVWRPGDSLYLTLALRDPQQTLSPGYPVVFELYNPAGQLMQKEAIAMQSPLVLFKSATPDDAMTGRWNLVARLGGVEFSRAVRIETIKPNRLKIDFSTSMPELRTGADNQIKLSARWLHGASAPGLNATVSMILQAARTTFSGYEGYLFDNQAESYEPSEQVVFEGQLSPQGDISFRLDVDPNQSAPGMMKAIFTPRVFEPGGDFSISQFTRTLHPYPVYAGFKMPATSEDNPVYPTGETVRLDLAAVDHNARGVSATLDLRVYKLHWRWWWDASWDYLGNYISGDEYRPVISKKIRLTGGKGSENLLIPNEEWGRYLIVLSHPDGHRAASVVFFDWSEGGAARQQGSGATMLALTTDKDQYKTGENIKASFPSISGRQALISIENGSRVLDKYWIGTDDGMTHLNIRATGEMAPNIYLFVTLLQPHGSTGDQPIRLYGVIPVMVEDPETRLTPVIDMAGELRSQKEFTVKISEKEGQAMHYTLAIVDEGLLDLTAFKTPDPWQSFFAREALGVKTWDLYDLVLGAYGGTLERLFAVGGDAGVIDPSKQKARRFEPVVKFMGPFKLAKGKNASHQITLPRYTGSVRVMAVAASQKAYGSSEKTVAVKDPLMVLATLPRVLGTNESFSLPVSVFVEDISLKTVKLQLTSNELLIPVAETEQSLNFSSTGEKTVGFALQTGSTEGVATLTLSAAAGGEQARYDIEVQVRNPNPALTMSESKLIAAEGSWKINVETIGNPGSAKNQLELSTAPTLNLGKRLGFLINYPHGCVEQTVSAAFPQIYLMKAASGDKEKRGEMEENIKTAIERLKSFQLSNGSFAYWPGSQQQSNWGTSYAGHFLLEAEKAGFSLPGDMKRNWLRYQRNAAGYWRRDFSDRSGALDQAYRLYTLALAKQDQSGAMNRLREQSDLPDEARWMLASAYALAGRSEAAAALVDFTRLTPVAYEWPGSTFGSSLRDQAILLEAMVLMNKNDEAMKLALDVSKALAGSEWMSTQTTAFCLVSMSRFIEAFGEGDGEVEVERPGDGETERLGVGKEVVRVELPIEVNPFGVTVKNTGKTAVYATLVREGIPVEIEVPVQQNGLAMKVFYRDLQGNELEANNIPQGTDIECKVIVKNLSPRAVDNLALTQVFAAGFEILNERMMGLDESTAYDYRDVRDDRVMTYFGLPANGQKEFIVRLNAAYAGSFLQPGAVCEAMYDHRISANVEAWRASIRQE